MENKTIYLPEEISIRTLASELKIQPTVLMAKLIKNGVLVSINQDIDYDTASLIVEEFGFLAEKKVTSFNPKNITVTNEATTRPPVVTIMGHVDHGKTSLLDYIRRTNVVATESGGITQSISAYQIEFTTNEKLKRKITFIDTPGHEAFSALRQHGASITDLIILVVATDDGVKPQTIEVIEHAKKMNVPIIVALNKIDAPGSNIDRVKQQLAENGINPEEWGGKIVMVPISAKTGQGVDELLEMVVLTSDLLELKADDNKSPEGIVIEANLDKQVGPLATVLIYNGTLHAGQVVVVGKTFGRVRNLEDDLGKKINQAGPSKPARLFGLKEVPQFGDRLEVVASEKIARLITQSSTDSSQTNSSQSQNTYNIVVKVDVGGSLVALEDSVKKIFHKDATVKIVSSGIGQLNENDISIAKASGALLISFRQLVSKRIKDLIEKENLSLKEYWVIYDAIEFLTTEVKKIATKIYQDVELGRVKILEVFSAKNNIQLIGGQVIDGEFDTNKEFKIVRQKNDFGKGVIKSLQIGKAKVDRVKENTECGLQVESNVSIERGDILTVFERREEK